MRLSTHDPLLADQGWLSMIAETLACIVILGTLALGLVALVRGDDAIYTPYGANTLENTRQGDR